MDARRLLLILATGAVAALLAQSLTSYHSDEEVAEAAVVPAPEIDRAERFGKPGDVVWSNWKDVPSRNLAPNEPEIRDVLAKEMRFEDLPDRVRERLEKDFVGLDVVLPKRSAVREREER